MPKPTSAGFYHLRRRLKQPIMVSVSRSLDGQLWYRHATEQTLHLVAGTPADWNWERAVVSEGVDQQAQELERSWPTGFTTWCQSLIGTR